MFPWYREDLVKTPFYDHAGISQTVSLMLFGGLCAYLWLTALRRGPDSRSPGARPPRP